MLSIHVGLILLISLKRVYTRSGLLIMLSPIYLKFFKHVKKFLDDKIKFKI